MPVKRKNPVKSISAPPPELQLDLERYVGAHFSPKIEKIIAQIARLYPDIDREFVGITIKDKADAPNVTDDFIMKYCDKPNKPYPKMTPGQQGGPPKVERKLEEQCTRLSSAYRSLCQQYVFNAYPYLPETVLTKALTDHFVQLTPTMNYLMENLTFFPEEVCLGEKSIETLSVERPKKPFDATADKDFLDEAILFEIKLQEECVNSENKVTNSLMTTLKSDYGFYDIRQCVQCGVQFFMDDMIVASCQNDEHYVCKSCFNNMFKNESKNLLPRITCGHPGCDALYDLDIVERIVPKEEFHHYLKQLQSGSIAVIHKQLPDWKQCMQCMQYTPLPPRTSKLFFCGNPECRAARCMECDGPIHWGVICPNILEKKLEEFQDYVNRAMNAKTVQTCPKCQHKVAKSEHCNHITCPKCGTHFCYLCGQNLGTTNIYGHFGNPPKCPLDVSNTTDEQRRQDYRRAHAAGVTAAAEWRRNNPEFAQLKLPDVFEIP